MTLRVVPDPESCVGIDSEDGLARAIGLRADLVVARLELAYWTRRVAALERELPVSSPLRRGSGGAGGA